MPTFDGKAWFRSKIAPYLTKIKSEIPPELDNATVAAGISNVYGVMTPAQLGTLPGISLHSTEELVVSVGAASTGADYQNIADAYNYFRQEGISPAVQPVIEIRGEVSALNAVFPNYSVRDLIIRGSSPLSLGSGHILTTPAALSTHMSSVNVDRIDLSQQGAISHLTSSLTFEHLFLHSPTTSARSFVQLHGSSISFRHCVLSNIEFRQCTGLTITVHNSIVFNTDLISSGCQGTLLKVYRIIGGGGITGTFKISIASMQTPVRVYLPAIVNTAPPQGGEGRIIGYTLYVYASARNDRFLHNKHVDINRLTVYVGDVSTTQPACMSLYRTRMSVNSLYLDMAGVATSNMPAFTCVMCDITVGEFSTSGNQATTPKTLKFHSSVANLRIISGTAPFHIDAHFNSDIRVISTSSNITYNQALNVRNSTTKSIIIK